MIIIEKLFFFGSNGAGETFQSMLFYIEFQHTRKIGQITLSINKN